MSSSEHHDYHLVDPSPLPLFASFAALLMFTGLVFFLHGKPAGDILLPAGFLSVIATLYFWWKTVIREGEKEGHHTEIVRKGLRFGMALFIASEVMFFFAFFWSFFWSMLDPKLLFDGAHIFENGFVEGIFPPEGVKTFDPWDLPLLNTLILLLSGTTVTWAHWCLLNDDRKNLVRGLLFTVLLGAAFTALQAFEYSHAAFGFKDGIYSSNFYMATGFHGAHVLIGTIFLAICLVRAKRGGFTKEGHLGFEFAAWYWHFVDVVWIFLFLFVYVLGR